MANGGAVGFGGLGSALLGGLAGPGTLALANSSSSALALSVGNNSANTTFSGVLQGSGSLTKVGSGELLFSGNNTYTGDNRQSRHAPGQRLARQPGDGPERRHFERHGLSRQHYGHAQRAACPWQTAGRHELSGSLNLESGAVMDYELDTPSTSSQVLMPTGELILSNQQFAAFDFAWSANFEPGSYNLIAFGSRAALWGTVSAARLTACRQRSPCKATISCSPSCRSLRPSRRLGLASWGCWATACGGEA